MKTKISVIKSYCENEVGEWDPLDVADPQIEDVVDFNVSNEYQLVWYDDYNATLYVRDGYIPVAFLEVVQANPGPHK